MHRLMIILLFLGLAQFGYSQDFANLDSLLIAKHSGIWFKGQEYTVQRYVIFNKSITTVINKRGRDIIDMIATKVDSTKADKYLIRYDPGPSADPTYHILKVNESDTINIGFVGADEIVLPGDGFIYTSGRSDRMYNVRQKFKIVDDKLIGIKQPYYFVGVQSITVKDITLFSDTLLLNSVTEIHKGTEVTVLLNIGSYFLIRSPYGLIGWVKIERGDHGSVIYDLFYLGD